jgi:hypothetical protein
LEAPNHKRFFGAETSLDFPHFLSLSNFEKKLIY